MLTYSVKPRGGVVHALEVVRGARARAATTSSWPRSRAPGEELFRPPRVPLHLVRTSPPDAPFDERIQAMLDAYREGLRPLLGDGGFDVVHAQDCLSANAALALRDEGVDRPRAAHRPPRRRLHVAVADRVPGPLDPRARPRALRLAAVGRAPGRDFGVDAGLVANGVDPRRFRPPRDARRARARARGAPGSASASRC